MFRFLLFGVITSVMAISFNVVAEEDECVKKCDAHKPINQILFLPHSSPGKFCKCDNIVTATVGSCGLDETWSDDKQTCVRHDDMTKGCATNCPKDCKILIAHNECSKYCHCHQGYSTIEECPGGFHFSKEKMICLPSEDAGCGKLIPRIRKHPDSSESASGCKGSCPLFNDPLYAVHLPHQNCQKFCICNWGTPVVKNCSADLHFNPKLQVCDYPFQANCDGYGSVKN